LADLGLPGVLWDASGWDNRFDDAGIKAFPILPSSAWPDVAKKALVCTQRLSGEKDEPGVGLG